MSAMLLFESLPYTLKYVGLYYILTVHSRIGLQELQKLVLPKVANREEDLRFLLVVNEFLDQEDAEDAHLE